MLSRKKIRSFGMTFRLHRALIERLEAENKKRKDTSFLNTSFTGMHDYDAEIINAIKNHGPIRTPKLLERLNIDPGDIQGLEALSIQLENLESNGLVERSPSGWMWAK